MKRAVLLGFDFGTLSCRLTAINAASGEIILECEDKYLHGVISDVLPDGETELNAGWNLQDADDYIKTLFNLILEFGLFQRCHPFKIFKHQNSAVFNFWNG